MATVIRSLCVLSVLGFATAMAAAQTAPPFSAATPWAIAGGPSGVVVRDVTGDGKPDLVAANNSTNKVSVAPGNGSGSFGAAVSYSVGAQPEGVAVGDLNTDGRLDLVVANQGSNSVSMLLGLAGGSFLVATNLAAGSGPRSVAIADVDRDGRPDIAVGNWSGNSVSLLRNVSAGGVVAFAPAVSFAVGSGPRGVSFSDVNRDGKPDLLTANMFTNDVSVLLNQTPYLSPPAFAAASSVAVGPDPYSVVATDLSGDGAPDLVATSIVGLVTVRLGNGLGGFAPWTYYAVGSQPQQVVVADLNRDGRPDLTVLNFNSLSVSVLMGQGAGIFCPQVSYGVGPAPTSLAVADVSGDGKLDIVAGNLSAGTVSVLLNQVASDGPLAFDGPTSISGGVGVPTGMALADFDLDGRLDLATASGGSGTVQLGTGTGDFGPGTPFATGGTNSRAMAAGDLDDNGLPDLVVINATSSIVAVLLNLGGGVFGAPQTYSAGGGNSSINLLLGDFDGNGRLDIAVPNAAASAVMVFLGQGGGTFGAAVGYGTAPGPIDLAAADLNRDGKLDLVASILNTPGAINVLPGLAGGAFAAAVNIPGPNSTWPVVVGDWSGDGKPDIVSGCINNVVISILNMTPDGGALALGGPVSFAGGPAPQDAALADLNRDGKLDLLFADGFSNGMNIHVGNGGSAFMAPTAWDLGLQPYAFAVADLNSDGRPDVTAAGPSPAHATVRLAQGPVVSAWTGLGYALEGVGGLPSLSGAGTLAPNSSCSLTLVNANPDAAALLFTSFASAPTAFKGGLLAAFPIAVQASVVTESWGGLALPFTWPSGVPSGTKIWFQYAVQDPAAIHNAALSNALMGLTP